MLQSVLERRTKALYLFPTKALSQDQVAELTELDGDGALGIRVFTFDGDTPGDARKAVRTRGDIVVSNPDMLHQGILPHHTKWAQFFESLAFVVIDELHSYRGVFGSHMANVVRRLRRVGRFYGVEPIFVLCSATIANPGEHAARLIGAPVETIGESGAPQGARTVLLWNPPLVNRELGIRKSGPLADHPHRAHGDPERPEEHRLRPHPHHGRGADPLPQGRLRRGPAAPAPASGPIGADTCPRSGAAPSAACGWAGWTAWWRHRRSSSASTSGRSTCAS